MATGHARARGREADRPSDIPRAGWFDIFKRVWQNVGHYEVSVISAGIAFNEFFALFPALAAAVSLYGLIADPATVARHLSLLAGVLPTDMQNLLGDQLKSVTSSSNSTLGWSLFISLALALWGATRGIKGVITGLNIVYGEDEKRGFFRLSATALGLTLAAIVFGLVALALIAAVPALEGFLPFGELGKAVASALRWPLLAIFLMIGLAVVYRYAPSRDEPRWRWVSWGAAIAAALWLIGSGLFSLYVARFGKFNETYGSMAAVAVMLLWFQLTAFVVLLGALLDAEMEHQTARDTTAGPEQPMGRRGARVADTLPPE
ncbi:MAG: YihY/virulence factor BrkB family protein [Solirubrobacterales bacterium]